MDAAFQLRVGIRRALRFLLAGGVLGQADDDVFAEAVAVVLASAFDSVVKAHR
jgi:hypothetical protein